MRDCILCLHKTVDGCDSWKCEYINRYDAAEAYRQTRRNLARIREHERCDGVDAAASAVSEEVRR